MPVSFDTLEYALRLRQAGFNEQQAEGLTQALALAMTDTLATKPDLRELAALLRSDLSELRTEFKRDLSELRTELKEDIAALRVELKDDISALRAELKSDVSELRAELKSDVSDLKTSLVALESRLTLRLGGLMVAGIGVVSVLVKLL